MGTLVSGLLAVAAVALVLPSRELSLHREPFRFNAAGGPREVTPSQPVEVGFPFGDFDLLADVELAEHTELDVVFRRVEPRYDGQQFHGRFFTLRLSSEERGPPYRTREEALFGDQPGGFLLAPGVPATLEIEARGRWARAYVAGRWLDWVETRDDHGGFLLAARGGKALLRALDIRPIDSGGRGLVWLLAPLLVMATGSVVFRRGGTVRRLAILLAIPLGAWLSSRVVIAQLLPMTAPDLTSTLLLALWPLPAVLALSAGRLRLALPGLLLGLVALELACRREVTRLAPFEDPRLSLYFGDHSAGAPLDALVGRLVSATLVDTGAEAERRVFFMGGKDIYEPLLREQLFRSDVDDRDVLALLTTEDLRKSLGEEVVGAVVPTLAAHSLQQLLLLSRFYLDFAPRVLVFAVTDAELGTASTGNARRAMEQMGAPRSPGLVLGGLLSPPREGPVSTPADLRQTLEEVIALCRDHSMALVLLVEADLPGSLLQVVRSAARAPDVGLCILEPWEDGEVRARQLHDAILPHLR